jgi:hypothetical protein
MAWASTIFFPLPDCSAGACVKFHALIVALLSVFTLLISQAESFVAVARLRV